MDQYRRGGRFFGRRVNCELVPMLAARIVQRVLDDPRKIPYLLAWRSSQDGLIKEAVRIIRLGPPPYIPLIVVFPTSLLLKSQVTGTISAPGAVGLTNNGPTALSGESIAFSGTNATDFAETDNCIGSVAAGQAVLSM